jgi:hypothetical protein
MDRPRRRQPRTGVIGELDVGADFAQFGAGLSSNRTLRKLEDGKAITPIPFGNAPSGSMQGPRYTTHEKLLKAKTLLELMV